MTVIPTPEATRFTSPTPTDSGLPITDTNPKMMGQDPFCDLNAYILHPDIPFVPDIPPKIMIHCRGMNETNVWVFAVFLLIIFTHPLHLGGKTCRLIFVKPQHADIHESLPNCLKIHLNDEAKTNQNICSIQIITNNLAGCKILGYC